MTKRDFQLIADVLKWYTNDKIGVHIAIAMAAKLKQANPRFKQGRFLEACGIDYSDAIMEHRT